MGVLQHNPSLNICRLWPDIVKNRIRDTYLYFGGSLAFTAGTAVAVLRSPRMMNLMMKNSIVVSLFVSSTAMHPCKKRWLQKKVYFRAQAKFVRRWFCFT